MRVQVDVELLRATAGPLREAVTVLDGLPAVSAQLRGAELGEPALGDAVERFLTCWSGGMSAVGQRGRALAGMLELAAGHYGAIEHRVGGQAREAGS